MVKNHSVKNWGRRKTLRFGAKTGDFYAGYKFRITPKFKYTLVVPKSTVLPLADRWTRGPLSVSSSPSGSFFYLFSPARFLHRRRLVCRASRPYRGSARRASCRCSVHSPRGPARCRHCSRIRLRTPAIGDERRWWTSPTVHRARAIKTAGVPLSSSSHLASLLLLLLPPLLLTKARARLEWRRRCRTGL